MTDDQTKRIENLEKEVAILKAHLSKIGATIEILAIQNANLSLTLAHKSNEEAEKEIEGIVSSINEFSSARDKWEGEE